MILAHQVSLHLDLSFVIQTVKFLIDNYEAVLSRIRACRAPIIQKAKQSDIDRILYSRGQEEEIDSDTLYAALSEIDSERISTIRKELTAQEWHLMDGEERLGFLGEFLPECKSYYDLFADFRCGGYRILGDLICDIDDENRATARKELFRDRDSAVFSRMMWAYLEGASAGNYRAAVAEECGKMLCETVKPKIAVQVLVALGRRDLLWELIPERAEKEVKRLAE